MLVIERINQQYAHPAIAPTPNMVRYSTII